MNKPVFDQWKGKPLQEILLTCRDVVEESDYSAARRWKESGGGIVGHFQVYFPEEIAHAAGLLPVLVVDVYHREAGALGLLVSP